MISDFKDKFKSLYERIKKVKHIEIYLAVGLAVIVAIVYFACVNNKKIDNTQSSKLDNFNTDFSTSSEYTAYLENKLESVITKVRGTGDVDVAVTLEKGFEYVYVTEEETRTTSNGTIITSKSVVMVNGQPVIQEEIYPVIKGIVVIASGADDVNVRMNILSIIQTVIEVDNSKINIYSGK